VREIPATYSVANFLQDPGYIQQIFVTSEPFFARQAGVPVRTLLISETGYNPYRVLVTSRVPFCNSIRRRWLSSCVRRCGAGAII
jgi:NitT/TauT family transport system substrate-binding protein